MNRKTWAVAILGVCIVALAIHSGIVNSKVERLQQHVLDLSGLTVNLGRSINTSRHMILELDSLAAAAINTQKRVTIDLLSAQNTETLNMISKLQVDLQNVSNVVEMLNELNNQSMVTYAQ